MIRLKELRTERNWSQAQLGARLSCTAVTISRYEQGQRQLDPAAINTLCELFGCSADYLLGRSTNRNPMINDEDALLLAAIKNSPPYIQESIRILLSPFMAADETEAS